MFIVIKFSSVYLSVMCKWGWRNTTMNGDGEMVFGVLVAWAAAAEKNAPVLNPSQPSSTSTTGNIYEISFAINYEIYR